MSELVAETIDEGEVNATKQDLYSRQRKYHSIHPWVKFLCWARRRCDPRDSRWRKFYYEKGVRCFLYSDDVRKVWIRDDADKLVRPSLDRISPAFSYVPWNIRFIEFAENARMGLDARRKK